MLRQLNGAADHQDYFDHYQESRDINDQMKRAACFHPPQWWEGQPQLRGASDEELQENTFKMLAQLEHNYLLLLLYQPYVIGNLFCQSNQPSEPTHRLHSKITALAAGRSIIAVLETLLAAETLPAAYKNLERKAQLSVTTMLLTHLDSHDGDINVFEHQRPQDLQTVQSAIDNFERLQQLTGDYTESEKIGSFRKLVAIEADTANGRACSFQRSRSLPDGLSSDDVAVEIPYFGYIHIKRQAPPDFVPHCSEIGASLIDDDWF